MDTIIRIVIIIMINIILINFFQSIVIIEFSINQMIMKV